MEKANIRSAEEQEKEESIWRRRLFGQWRRGRTEKEKIFGEGKYLVSGGNEKERKHLFSFC